MFLNPAAIGRTFRRALVALIAGALLLAAVGALPAAAVGTVLAYAVVGALVLAATSPASPSILAATVVGAITETSTPDAHKVRHVDQRLTLRAPQANPLNTTLRKLRRGPRATAEKVSWETDDVIPRRTLASGATSAGSAGAAVTVALDEAIYQPDDLILLPGNQILVVETVSGSNVDFRRWDTGTSGYGTVPAIADDAVLVRIGNAKHEGYGFSAPRSTMPGEDYNYIEEVDATIEISTRRMNTRNYTINDFQRSRDRQTYDFLSSEELKLFYGRREKKSITRGGVLVNVTTMGGLVQYNLPKQLTYAANTLSQANVIEWHRVLFSGNAGAQVRYAFVDDQFAADMAKVPLDQVQRTNMDSQTLRYGVVKTTMAGLGTIIWIPNQAFTVAGKSRVAWILDIEQLDWLPFQAMDITRRDKKQTGKNMVEVNISEAYTMIPRYLETHMLITGTAT